MSGARLIERVLDLASEAGGAAMRFYGTALDVDRKADASPVTVADRAAHECITSGLARLDPGTPIVSEESGVPPFEIRKEWERFWLVDPLDGTKEFIAANGEFTINIALIQRGEPVIGVVVAPAFDAAYFASRELGAWRQESGKPTVRLCGGGGSGRVTRVVESRSHPSPELEAFIATLGRVERTRLGSSLKFCRVAEGASDLYPRFGRTYEWDVAAGDCVYRYSGPNGHERRSPLTYNQPELTTGAFVIGRPNTIAHLSQERDD